MKGIDSCEKCILSPVCISKRDVLDFSLKTTIILNTETSKIQEIENGIYKLLADSCKYYDVKGGDNKQDIKRSEEQI